MKIIKINAYDHDIIIQTIKEGSKYIPIREKWVHAYLLDSITVCPWLAMKNGLTVSLDNLEFDLSDMDDKNSFYHTITTWKEGTYKIEINLEKFGTVEEWDPKQHSTPKAKEDKKYLSEKLDCVKEASLVLKTIVKILDS